MILLCLFYTHKIIIPFLMQMNIKDLESQTSEKVMDHELSNLTDAILHERFDEKKKIKNWQREMKLYLTYLKYYTYISEDKLVNLVGNTDVFIFASDDV